MNIEWSEEFEANTEIHYNYINTSTPVGEFSVQWKGWKEWDSKCVYLNDKYLNSFCEIGEIGDLLDVANEAHIKRFLDFKELKENVKR